MSCCVDTTRAKGPVLTVTLVFGGVTAALLVTGMYASSVRPDTAAFFSDEGGVCEWLSFLSLFTASWCILILHAARRSRDGLRWWSAKSVGMLILAAVLLFGALEEVSWGQHLFHWRTPAFFESRNVQREMNIHNLQIGEARLNELIFNRLLFGVMAVHNVVLPVLALKKRRAYQWAERVGGFLPPLPLVSVYAAATAGAHVAGIYRPSELPEAVGALHYLASILTTYGLGFGMETPVARTPAERRWVARTVLACLVGLPGLACGMALLVSPAKIP